MDGYFTKFDKEAQVSNWITELNKVVQHQEKDIQLIRQIIFIMFTLDQKSPNKGRMEVRILQNEAIINTKGGRILKRSLNIASIQFSDKINEASQMPQVLENLEQIKYLKWIGEYGQTIKNKDFGNQHGKENPYKGQVEGIEVNQDGKKEGRWMDIFKNYWSKAQVYEVGDYYNYMRIGQWKYLYKDYKAGGGDYNIKELKCGKWIEFIEWFSESTQVTNNGEYDINGMKVGRWDIINEEIQCKFSQSFNIMNQRDKMQILFLTNIQNGTYDKFGNQRKIGIWVELDEWFNNEYQTQKRVTYNGEYNLNG